MSASDAEPKQSDLGVELFLLSFASLFLELLAIRWLSSEIRAFSIYKNFPLITCFVGLGGGFLLACRGERFFRFFPWLLLALTIIVATSDLTGLAVIVAPSTRTITGHVWGDLVHPPAMAVSDPLLYTALSFGSFFSLLTLLACTFAALGERIGRLFNAFVPLRAYSVNLLGATFGIIGFALLSFLCTGPTVWMAVAVVPLLYSFRKQKLGALALILCVATAGLMPLLNRPQPASNGAFCGTLWSPYHRVDIEPFYWKSEGGSSGQEQIGYNITVNKAFFQQPLNLSQQFLGKLAGGKQLADFKLNLYEFPYLLLNPTSVLVMGSGTGNDVAAALRHKVGSVQAVEIDPLMVKLGHELHAEKPYDAPNVKVDINDARAFLRQTPNQYDLVLTGVLDSHTVAGNSLSVRLDDYVYTADGLRDALARVKPGGLLNISYCATEDFLAKRIAANLRLAAGGASANNIAVFKEKGTDIWHYLAPVTPEFRQKLRQILPADYEDLTEVDVTGIRPSTDDWPYLYLRPMTLDPTYLSVCLAALLLAWAVLGKSVRQFQTAHRWHLFFLGAGFLLVELAIVDRLALIFGTTWIVNSVAIFAVMVTITLANLLVLKYPFKLSAGVLYSLLLGLMVVLYFVPVERFNALGVVTGGLLAALLSAVPIFFAGIIFSRSFAKEEQPSVGLAFNTFGAVVGGLLEYAATYTGLRSLLLIAAMIYVLSYLFYRRAKL
jgi:hypothetical protein